MVLMSTGHVEFLIDSCISSIILFLTHDLVQVVPTSTFSFFVFSFFSFSCPAARSSSDSGGGEGEKQIEVAALKSTGWRRRAHRSASPARAAHRTPNSSALYLQPGSASAVTALASPQLPVK